MEAACIANYQMIVVCSSFGLLTGSQKTMFGFSHTMRFTSESFACLQLYSLLNIASLPVGSPKYEDLKLKKKEEKKREALQEGTDI